MAADGASNIAMIAHGCPSGLAPPADPGAIAADPAVFVRAAGPGQSAIELMVKGARCAGCIRKIEGGLLAEPDVLDARLNLTTGRLALTWQGGAARARDFAALLLGLGYEAAVFDPEAGLKAVDKEGRALLRRLAVAGFAAMNIMLFSVPVWAGGGEMGPGVRTFLHWISAIIAIPAALYAAQPFFRSAGRALRVGRANMDVPISLGVVLTLSMSLVETALGGPHAYFDGATMLLFFLLIGRYLDHRLREKARAAARDLLALQAVSATRIDGDGIHRAVAARDIAVGDRIALAAGDRVPVDGVVIEGTSDADRAIITGESAPAPVRVGDPLEAGAVNLTRPIVMLAQKIAAQSTVAELARLIETGEQGRARFRRIADRAAALYVPFVHSAAALTFLGWLVVPILLRQWGVPVAPVGLRQALLNAVAVLIITCPCALGLAAPAVQIVATGRLFRRGVLVKSGDALERLAAADCVVLDKTGTLTLGRPALKSAIAAEDLAAAALLARASRHPLSRALVAAAGPGAVAKGVVETPGAGLAASVAGEDWRLGNRAFALGADEPAAQSAPPTRAGRAQAELWLARPGRAPVQFLFEDALRPDAAAFVAGLARRGLGVELLSGDRAEPAAQAAASAGITMVSAGITPQGKVARLAALRQAGRRPLMVGDGLNDAAALASAHVSASPGAAIGASQAAADFVFQSEALAPLAEAIDIARAARKRVIENFAFSALYNLCAIPIAVLGLVTPLIAAIAMSASSVIVMLNALRLADFHGHPDRRPAAGVGDGAPARAADPAGQDAARRDFALSAGEA